MFRNERCEWFNQSMNSKKNQNRVILIILCVISIYSSGCIESETEWYQSGQYMVEIIPNENSTYHVTLPLLVKQDETSSTLMDDLTIILGDGSFKEIDTDKGLALAITANTTIVIGVTIEKVKGKGDFIHEVLSLEKDTNYNGDISYNEGNLNFWTLFDNNTSVENIEINIIFKASEFNSEKESENNSECFGILSPNSEWQFIKGFRSKNTIEK